MVAYSVIPLDLSESSSESGREEKEEKQQQRVARVQSSGVSFVKSAQVLYDSNRQVRVTEQKQRLVPPQNRISKKTHGNQE